MSESTIFCSTSGVEQKCSTPGVEQNVCMKKDYYDILGVDKKASKDEIKRAFHKLAKKYHPDNGSTGDEARFKEVGEAYQTLSNDKKRAEYDTYGHTFAGGAGGGNPFEGFGQGFSGFSAQGFDLNDLFGDLFGGQHGGGRRQQKRGRDISVDLQFTFADAIFGVERTILLAKTAECEVCAGTGGEKDAGFEACSSCNGQGQVHETRQSILGAMTSVRECSVCHGRGRSPKKKCSPCSGLGVDKKQQEIKIKVPAGIVHGEMIRLTGMGEAVPHGVPGDLYVKVHVEAHPTFTREGNNLLMDLNIKLTDALLGGTYTITTLEGDAIDLKVPAGVAIGEVLRVKGKGVPHERSKRGDLLVTLKIQLPKRLSRRAKKIVEDLRKEGI